MQIVRKLKPVDEIQRAREKRHAEQLAEIELIKDGRRPIASNAYSRKGEVLEHPFWPPDALAKICAVQLARFAVRREL